MVSIGLLVKQMDKLLYKNQEKWALRAKQVAQLAYSYAKNLHKSDLNQDIRNLWWVLTQDRADSLSDYFQKPDLLRGYLGYYLPVYAYRIAALWEKLRLEGHWEPPNRLQKVLDLGAGPLVGAFASYIAFGELDSYCAVDRQTRVLNVGKKLFGELPGPVLRHPVHLISSNVTGPWSRELSGQTFDWILLSNVLNEIGSSERFVEQRVDLLARLRKLLSPNGKILIVEPSHRLSTRQLMQLRDEIFHDDKWHILAPCTGADRCPLLADSWSWCRTDHQRCLRPPR
jgi:ribosomal protein RSM22 (predicted rRNA methylase)